jgi:acyl-CoA synthetase (AMP-forming)/AMP-acid ligase II
VRRWPQRVAFVDVDGTEVSYESRPPPRCTRAGSPPARPSRWRATPLMADYAVPKVVELVDALPHNAVGKTDKAVLR